VCELNASGTVTATNTFGAHGLLSRSAVSGESATSTFYTFDPQGGVAQRLTSSDAVTDTDAYNAWGSRTSTGGGDVFTFGAQWGYYTDGETGLVLCGHRYYDPARGRWLTRDPIGYAGGVGLYGYCQDEPTIYLDYSGWLTDGGGDFWGGAIVGVGLGILTVMSGGTVWVAIGIGAGVGAIYGGVNEYGNGGTGCDIFEGIGLGGLGGAIGGGLGGLTAGGGGGSSGTPPSPEPPDDGYGWDNPTPTIPPPGSPAWGPVDPTPIDPEPLPWPPAGQPIEWPADEPVGAGT